MRGGVRLARAPPNIGMFGHYERRHRNGTGWSGIYSWTIRSFFVVAGNARRCLNRMSLTATRVVTLAARSVSSRHLMKCTNSIRVRWSSGKRRPSAEGTRHERPGAAPRMKADVPFWISPAVIGGAFLVMLLAEALRPLRARVEPKLRHTIRNLSTGGISLAVLTLLQAPLLMPVARWAEQRDIGIVRWLDLPRPWSVIVTIVLLDYTLWWWHWASHVVPVLWRFHLVHHVDLDLDSSTALRFHFGELTLSVFYRAAQIVLIGASPFSVWLWQTILFASILFHHGNLRLPQTLERVLARFIVTPRMHGIHHSDRREETNSNWSSLLSVWDFLHRTLRLDVPDESIRIGVPAYREPREVSFGRIQLLPLVPQRDDWREDRGSESSAGSSATR